MTTKIFDLFKVRKITRVRRKVSKKSISKNIYNRSTYTKITIIKKKIFVALYKNGKTNQIRTKANSKK